MKRCSSPYRFYSHFCAVPIVLDAGRVENMHQASEYSVLTPRSLRYKMPIAMTRLILVRHGETEWNVSEVFRGRYDVALSDIGVRQAELVGQRLASWTIEAVYSSPLKRALDTARCVARYHGLDVRVADGLLDFNYGLWEGLSHLEVKERYGELYQRWLTEPHRVEMPGGETLDQVAERARGVVDRVVSEHSGTVALVSHRVVNKVLICSMLGLDNSRFWDIRQDLAGITAFEYEDGRFVLTLHNDTCHLGEIGQRALADF